MKYSLASETHQEIFWVIGNQTETPLGSSILWITVHGGYRGESRVVSKQWSKENEWLRSFWSHGDGRSRNVWAVVTATLTTSSDIIPSTEGEIAVPRTSLELETTKWSDSLELRLFTNWQVWKTALAWWIYHTASSVQDQNDYVRLTVNSSIVFPFPTTRLRNGFCFLVIVVHCGEDNSFPTNR